MELYNFILKDACLTVHRLMTASIAVAANINDSVTYLPQLYHTNGWPISTMSLQPFSTIHARDSCCFIGRANTCSRERLSSCRHNSNLLTTIGLMYTVFNSINSP